MGSPKRQMTEKSTKRPARVAIAEEAEAAVDHDKSKVECVCPKCGRKHIMNFHWIGRGTPRKYCQSCRDSI
jgi:transposase-like protein